MPKVQRAMAEVLEITDVDTDVEDKGRQINLVIDREAATRLGVSMSTISTVLNNSFQPAPGIGDVRPAQPISRGDGRGPALRAGYRVAQAGGSDHRHRRARAHVGLRPLRGCQCAVERAAPGVVRGRHRVVQPGAGRVSGQATAAIDAAVARIGLPSDQIQAGFQGTAAALQQTLAQQPWLILAALVTMYIVLGILYESFVHPLTILSTLPSAGLARCWPC